MTTPSQRGRSNRARGQDTERRVATYLKPWFPHACRAVRNTDPDPGDLAETHPDLWWSIKGVRAEAIGPWMDEAAAKAVGRVGLLVVRRYSVADPARWACWMTLPEFLVLAGGGHPDVVNDHDYVRAELGAVVRLLVAAGYSSGAS